MIRVYIMIIVVGLVGGVVYGGYAYYQDTQQRLKTLQQNNAKLEVAVKSKDEALNFMTSNFEKQSELNKELSSKLADAEKENTIIRDKLAKSNLIADSIANPKVMEQKINEEVSTIFGALVILLSSCSSKPEKEIVTVETIVKPTIAIAQRPRPVEFDELKVKVITEPRARSNTRDER